MNGRRIGLQHSACVDVTFILFDPDRQATTVPPAACVYTDGQVRLQSPPILLSSPVAVEGNASRIASQLPYQIK